MATPLRRPLSFWPRTRDDAASSRGRAVVVLVVVVVVVIVVVLGGRRPDVLLTWSWSVRLGEAVLRERR